MQHATIKHSDQLVTAAANHFDFCTCGRVLVAMTTFARQQEGAWVCWPSKATLAELAGVTSRTVQTAIKQLADAGLISIQSRLARSSIYRLNAALIVKPSQAVINAIASIVTMTTSLAERVATATSRLQAIREQYKQGRSETSPRPEKPNVSPRSDRGDRSDRPNKDLVTSNKRSEQHAGTAPASSKKSFPEKAAASVNAIKVWLIGGEIKISKLSAQLHELTAQKAPERDRILVAAELEKAQAKYREHLDMARQAGIQTATA